MTCRNRVARDPFRPGSVVAGPVGLGPAVGCVTRSRGGRGGRGRGCVGGGRAGRGRWPGAGRGGGCRRAGPGCRRGPRCVVCRSRASRVSRRAVRSVVAVEARWSNQTPRASRAACSTPAAWSGSQRSMASWTSSLSLPGVRRAVAGGDDGEVPVHEVDRGPGQGRRLVGDPAGLPRLQPPVVDQGPQPGQPEAELDGLADQPVGGAVGEVQGGGEGLQGVLRDPGSAVPTQRRPRAVPSAGTAPTAVIGAAVGPVGGR